MRCAVLLPALALVTILACASCSTLHVDYGIPLDSPGFARLEAGVTRRSDVLAELGPPMQVARHGTGVALLYEHVALDETQLGLSLSSLGSVLGFPLLGMFKLALGSSESTHRSVVLLFDRDHTLVAIGDHDWVVAVGRGNSVQLFAEVDEVVDAGVTVAEAEQLTWGFELWAPLPETLNLTQREDLQMRGTPIFSGQRVLEFPRR